MPNGAHSQEKYDSIMETIVKKDEEVKQYRTRVINLESSLRAKEDKEQSMQEEILEIRK